MITHGRGYLFGIEDEVEIKKEEKNIISYQTSQDTWQPLYVAEDGEEDE